MRLPIAHIAFVFLLAAASLHAQTAPTPEAAPATLPPPTGEVLFERHTETDPPAAAQPTTAQPEAPELTDAERSAIRITAYDLDARLTPATSHLGMRAVLTLRNTGATPLTRIALQVSGTLTWQSVTLLPARTPLQIAQHLLETDADHTGSAREVVLTLPTPLAAGASVTLDTFYEGEVAANATRLTRIGASPAQAAATDWDAIAAEGTAMSGSGTALRGFGNVLWYPVSSPALFLGDGAKLFQAIAAARLRDQAATIRLRLSVEYHGEPPVAAYFCGRRAPLTALLDDPDMPIAYGAGIASGEFPAEPIGFRLPNLFLVGRAETLIAPLPAVATSSSAATNGAPTEAAPTELAGPSLLAVETNDEAVLPRLADSALSIAPLIQQWLGPRPLSALTLLDHTGEPFEDGPLVVAPAATLAASSATAALAHSLTHAWVQTGQPWMDEGLAQFMSLLLTEQQQGRTAMVSQLTDLLQPLVLAEPAFTAPGANAGFPHLDAEMGAGKEAGEPLIASANELYYRRKAAAVWLMLRGIAGDGALAAALTAWRAQPVSHDPAATQAVGFERLLEKLSNKDLGWFFRDWVLNDRGLPELTILDIAPRTLPAGKGHDSGWLVAVTVHNDGAAEVEVPIIIRSGTYSTTKRLRIPAFGNVTDRVVVEAAPTEVVVNDGTTPETTVSIHTRAVVLNP